mmetsp:Transcript_16575/g.20265  ORF Transcript_16575/g.20265 Transcript_16575/m.20265 type:complete len:128 (-) Transcript_16575:353-736(-)
MLASRLVANANLCCNRRLILSSCRSISTTAHVSSSMSKSDLIEMIATDHELSNAKSMRIVNSIFDTIAEKVSNQEKVSISGFGHFTNVYRKERNGRNPMTGEPLVIPSARRIKFSAYTSLKAAVNKK